MSQKTKQQVHKLVKARAEFAGIGTRKAKLALNKLATTDSNAHALRVALEIEDVNLTAKRYFGGDCGGYTYAQLSYLKKSANIERLIEISKSQGWTFGVQPFDAIETTHIIYFDVPGVGQLSWHYSPTQTLPDYPGEWDGKEGSTLPKLEAAIRTVLGETQAA